MNVGANRERWASTIRGGTSAACNALTGAVNLTMTEAERQAFLADLHIGVISIERPDGPPLTVPIWYVYEPGGDLWVLTPADSVKGRLLEQARRFSLCVQDERPRRYAYVTVEGPVVAIEAPDTEADRRPMARRYMGDEDGDRYVAGNDVAVMKWTMRPERWWSVDYGKLGLAEPVGG
jgi:nitroimidazol reductase NimA-like FMN-containing flavoprotein (pyridoxamine 5'-phosphate oxidase superfamily)